MVVEDAGEFEAHDPVHPRPDQDGGAGGARGGVRPLLGTGPLPQLPVERAVATAPVGRLDCGMSGLILAQVAAGNTALAALARAVLASLLTHLGPTITLGNTDSECLTEARKRRAADPSMSESETHLLDDAMELILELTPARP